MWSLYKLHVLSAAFVYSVLQVFTELLLCGHITTPALRKPRQVLKHLEPSVKPEIHAMYGDGRNDLFSWECVGRASQRR